MADTIGYIGVGAMGGPMAKNLLKAGFTVIVHDMQQDRVDDLVAAGAQKGQGVLDIANRAQIVMVCLNTIDAAKDVAAEVAKGSAVEVYVDQSTTGPTIARELRGVFAGTKIQMLDAPISGGVDGAAAGTLSVMASGPRAAFDRVKPAFDAMGKNVFFLGENPGNGQMMKVANNYLGNVATVATAEALTMGKKFGLDPKMMIDVLMVSTGRNQQIEGRIGRAIRAGAFDAGGNIKIGYKDSKAALEEAAALGAPTLTGDKLVEIYGEAMASGGDKQGSVAVINYIAAKGGVKLVG